MTDEIERARAANDLMRQLDREVFCGQLHMRNLPKAIGIIEDWLAALSSRGDAPMTQTKSEILLLMDELGVRSAGIERMGESGQPADFPEIHSHGQAVLRGLSKVRDYILANVSPSSRGDAGTPDAAVLKELREARTAWHEDFGVPISEPYARFLTAIGGAESALAHREATQPEFDGKRSTGVPRGKMIGAKEIAQTYVQEMKETLQANVAADRADREAKQEPEDWKQAYLSMIAAFRKWCEARDWAFGQSKFIIGLPNDPSMEPSVAVAPQPIPNQEVE